MEHKLSWNRIHFKNYEKYCMNYHQQESNQITYHWDHVPESVLFDSGFITNFHDIRMKRKGYYQNGKYYNIVREYGLDGISIDNRSDSLLYHGIQCKLWDTNKSIYIDDLETFFKKMKDFREKNESSKGYLYHTCKLHDTLCDHVDIVENRIFHKKLHYNEIIQDEFLGNDMREDRSKKMKGNEDFLYFSPDSKSPGRDDDSRCNSVDPKDPNRVDDFSSEPPVGRRPAKEDDSLLLAAYLRSDKRVESSYELRTYQKEAVEAMDHDWKGVRLLHLPCGTGKTIIFCNHVKRVHYEHIFIISPLQIHTKQNLKRMKYFLPDHDTLLLDSDSGGTTDFEDLIEKLNKKCIISSTFASAKSLISLLFYQKKKINLSNTILIIDEAHNLCFDENNELLKIVLSFPKVLLVTATPPNCMKEVIECEVVYQYPFRQAIEEKYICDYQIYIPMINQEDSTDSTYSPLLESVKDIELVDLNEDYVKKSLYLINGMLQTGSTRCIAYLSSRNECDEFMNVCKDVFEKYHFLPHWINIITSDISCKKEREAILEEFQKEDNDHKRLKILCSIRILDEGVDIPACDSIFVGSMYEKSSTIRMVQRICRANRLMKDHPNKVANCFLWTEDINSILDTLSLLKENDIEFHRKIRMMSGNYDNQSDRIFIENRDKKNREIGEYVRIKCINYQELWNMKRDLLFEFSNLHQRPPKALEDYKGVSVGRWFHQQKHKSNIHNTIYTKLSQNKYIKESLDEYLGIIDRWKEKRDLLFEFCNQYKRIIKSNEIYKDENIGSWLSIQKRDITSSESILYQKLSENIYVKESLDTYLINKEKNKDKIELSWDEKKDILFQFCNEKERVPKSNEIYKDLKISLWYFNQRTKMDCR